jgi:hypothetical protein
MNKSQYWKNFKLGKELDISGRFIYNGLQCFHHMEHFHSEEDIFEFLYNISVGIERLLKVCVILIEHSDDQDQEEFEKSLITHNHQELLKRVKKHYNSISLASIHNDFLQILGKFYISYRYGRYGLATMETKDGEKVQLHRFIEKHLEIKIDDEPSQITRNNPRSKKFIGKIIGRIAEELFKVIETEARRLNIFTYETLYGSKASKIFMFKKYHFLDEDIVWKELLIFLMNSDEESGQIKFAKSIEPLDLDPALAADYMQCLSSDVKKLKIMDEIETYYEELEEIKERLQMLEVIGNPHVYFNDEEDTQ